MAKRNAHRIQPGQNFTRQFSEMRQSTELAIGVLASEVASRRKDPYEHNYMGVLTNTDPLVQEKGISAFDLYKDLTRDPEVFSNNQKRIYTMIARPWQVSPVEETPNGTRDAETITEILKRIRFDQVCKSMMDALVMGISYSEVVWCVRDGFIVPERIVKRLQKRFVFKDVDENMPPDLRLITKENMVDGTPLPARKFIVHRYGEMDDNPYGQGLGLQLYWPVFFKRLSVVAWNKLNDRFGSPTPWGKYRNGASHQEKQTLLDALIALSNDGAVITPDDSSIALIEASVSGNMTSHESMCKYMDNAIGAVLIGKNGAESSGGALAAASNERKDILNDLAQADSDLLSDTLNETLITWICELNGFETCQVSRQVKEEKDQKVTAETFNIVSGMGFKPSIDMVRNQFGDGWEVNSMPTQQPYNPYASGYGGSYSSGYRAGNNMLASFAEGQRLDDLDMIDNTVKDMDNDQLDELMMGIVEPLLKAIEGSKSFEEALAAAQAAMPDVDSNKLQSMLARFMFGAQVVGHGIEKKQAE